MVSANQSKPHLQVIKGEAVPLSSAHRELLQMFIDYLRRLPELEKNAEGGVNVHTRPDYPYGPLIAILLNHYSARDFGVLRYGQKSNYTLSPSAAFPSEVHDEIWGWIEAARFVDELSERRRAVLKAENYRRRAGEVWDWYVEAREELGLKPADAPWNVKRSGR
jgi:hypothetical protein